MPGTFPTLHVLLVIAHKPPKPRFMFSAPMFQAVYCTPSEQEDDNAALNIELVPEAVCVNFGTVMQLNAHTETRMLVVENRTEQDIVLDIEQNADGRTPMTLSSNRLIVMSSKRAEVGFILNTSLQEGSHSFGFGVGLRRGTPRSLSTNGEYARTEVIAKVEVRRPSVRLQTKHIQLGPVAARIGVLKRQLQLVNDSDLPVRVKAAVQQEDELAVEVTVNPSGKLLKPNGKMSLDVQVDTDTARGKVIASIIVVAVGRSDNLLQCSCTGYLVEPCVALGVLPQVTEQARNQALEAAREKAHLLREKIPLPDFDVAEIARPQKVAGSDGQPLFSVQCSSLYFGPGCTKATVMVQSHRPTERIRCWGKIQGLEDLLGLRCVPPTPIELGPEAQTLHVTTCEPAEGCAGLAGTLVVYGGSQEDAPIRAVVPIGGALLPKKVRLPDVELGETTSVSLFLANHSVAIMPFHLDGPVRGDQNGYSHRLQIEPDSGDLSPGEVVQVDLAYRSRPDQSTGEIKGLHLAATIGGCPKTDVPIVVRAGHKKMATTSTIPQTHVDLSKMDKYCTQDDKGRRMLKPQTLSLCVKNVGTISATLTNIQGAGITLADSVQARREIQPAEERKLDFGVALGSLVDCKREFTLEFGSFRLECAWKTKVDGPKLAFQRATTAGPKPIRKFDLGVISGQPKGGIAFYVANGGNRILKYRMVGAIVILGGAADVKVKLGEQSAEESRELKKKDSDEWHLHIEEMTAGPIGIMATFEAENLPTLVPDGEVLSSCRHSLYFSGHYKLAGSDPGLNQIRFFTPHESEFGVHHAAFVRLAIDRSKTLEARALGMPLAVCSIVISSIKSMMALDGQPEDQLDRSIVELDPSVIRAVLGREVADAEATTLATATKSTMARNAQVSAVVSAGAALHEFATFLMPERWMLLDLASKLLEDTPRKSYFDSCENFLSLDACRPRSRGGTLVGTPTLPCWTRFRELVKPKRSSATTQQDVSGGTIEVLSPRSKAALRLQPFFAGLRNLKRTGDSGVAVWAPLAMDLLEHLDMESRALIDVCAEPVVGTRTWVRFVTTVALKDTDPACATALCHVLEGHADTDTVLQIAISFSGGCGGASSGSRGKLLEALHGLKALKAHSGTPLQYTQHFLCACGGGMAKVARIFDLEFNARKATSRLAYIWELFTYNRTDLTTAMEPLVGFFHGTTDAVIRLTELTNNLTPETAGPQVIVENAAELLALAQHEDINDMVKAAAQFLERFAKANKEESKIIRRRQDAFLLLYKFVKCGNGATRQDVCPALADLALCISSTHKSFATWIRGVSSSTFMRDYSVGVGVEALRKLASLRGIATHKRQVLRLVGVLDTMEVFRKGKQDVDCGAGILMEVLPLVQGLQTESETQDSLSRLMAWVKFCCEHESPKERIDAYVVRGDLPAPKLGELHQSACEFNGNPHRSQEDMGSLHHMQELYTIILEKQKWSVDVVSHAMPLMHAVHLLQTITDEDMGDDDSQYQTAFASFLAVVSLLQLEKDAMLCANASWHVSASVPRVDVLPPPPSNDDFQTSPPAPPTYNADENAGKLNLEKATSADASSTPGGSQQARSGIDTTGGAGGSSTCGGSQHARSGVETAGGAGASSTCGGQSRNSISTASATSVAGSGSFCALDGADAGTRTAGMRGSLQSPHDAPGSTARAAYGPSRPDELESKEFTSNTEGGDEAELPEGGDAIRSVSGAPAISMNTALGAKPGATGRSVKCVSSASAGVWSDQGDDGLTGSESLDSGVDESPGHRSRGSAPSAGTRDGRNICGADSRGSWEEAVSRLGPSNQSGGSIASPSSNMDLSGASREDRNGSRGRGDSISRVQKPGGAHQEGKAVVGLSTNHTRESKPKDLACQT